MSQHDFTIENQTAASARADINNALQALASTSSGSSAPTPVSDGMLWYDTGSNRLKLRENSAWVEIGTFTGGTFSVAGLTLASKAEAEAGTDNTKLMTPLRTKQSIEELSPNLSLSGSSVITESRTVTIPAGMIASVVAVGAGGSGAASTEESETSGGAVSGGGGAGAVCMKSINAISGAVTLTVTIGASAAAANRISDGVTNGNAGGSTTVTATGVNMVAGGGGGGQGSSSSGTGEISTSTVSGGVATGGDLNIDGAGVGVVTKTSGNGAWAGAGASPFESVPATSGRVSGESSSNSDPSVATVGLGATGLSGGYGGRSCMDDTDGANTTTKQGQDGALGCGGGGAAVVTRKSAVATSGEGGSGFVIFTLAYPA